MAKTFFAISWQMAKSWQMANSLFPVVLDDPNGPVTEVDEILKVASDFYKDLFKKENPSGFSLQNNFFSASQKVSPAENKLLEAPFSKTEVKEAIFSSYPDGDPGPDGIPFF